MMPQRVRAVFAVTAFVVCALGSAVRADSAKAPGPLVDDLRSVLRNADETEDMAHVRARLVQKIEETLPRISQNVLGVEIFQSALEKARTLEDATAVEELRRAVREVIGLLIFRPLMEAPLPAGFPAPTPVGEIRVSYYPAYRLARVKMDGTQNRAFMTLFNHIKKNEIAMTAPVEITRKENESKDEAMSFLYRNQDLGTLGNDGSVEVVDIPAMTTVSFGVRGNMTKSAIAEAESRLQKWLSDHQETYSTIGPFRVLGYNSPFIPGFMRYFEVQVPVRKSTTQLK